jgi:hypothetical protein
LFCASTIIGQRRLPQTRPGAIPMLGSLAMSPGGLITEKFAIDGTGVYWTGPDCPAGQACSNEDVYTAPLAGVPDGGGGTIVATGFSGSAPQGIAVDDTNVYWTTSNTVLQAPKAGRTPITLWSGTLGAAAMPSIRRVSTGSTGPRPFAASPSAVEIRPCWPRLQPWKGKSGSWSTAATFM